MSSSGGAGSASASGGGSAARSFEDLLGSGNDNTRGRSMLEIGAGPISEAAQAEATKISGIPVIGVVYGKEPPPGNATLAACRYCEELYKPETGTRAYEHLLPKNAVIKTFRCYTASKYNPSFNYCELKIMSFLGDMVCRTCNSTKGQKLFVSSPRNVPHMRINEREIEDFCKKRGLTELQKQLLTNRAREICLLHALTISPQITALRRATCRVLRHYAATNKDICTYLSSSPYPWGDIVQLNMDRTSNRKTFEQIPYVKPIGAFGGTVSLNSIEKGFIPLCRELSPTAELYDLMTAENIYKADNGSFERFLYHICEDNTIKERNASAYSRACEEQTNIEQIDGIYEVISNVAGILCGIEPDELRPRLARLKELHNQILGLEAQINRVPALRSADLREEQRGKLAEEKDALESIIDKDIAEILVNLRNKNESAMDNDSFLEDLQEDNSLYNESMLDDINLVVGNASTSASRNILRNLNNSRKGAAGGAGGAGGAELAKPNGSALRNKDSIVNISAILGSPVSYPIMKSPVGSPRKRKHSRKNQSIKQGCKRRRFHKRYRTRKSNAK